MINVALLHFKAQRQPKINIRAVICQKQISVEGNGHCCHRPSSNWETVYIILSILLKPSNSGSFKRNANNKVVYKCKTIKTLYNYRYFIIITLDSYSFFNLKDNIYNISLSVI